MYAVFKMDETTTTRFFTIPDDGKPDLRLKTGERLRPITLAYETYGRLSTNRDNAILLFHALSGSQHAAGYTPSVRGTGTRWAQECREGWWTDFIGPGKALDTDRFFVVCANYLGGCYGSLGPASLNPATGRPYGSLFPRISLCDIVDSQMRLVESLGIRRLRAAIGGSLGGLLALTLATRYPQNVSTVIPIACGLEVSILQRILNFEQIFSIEEDPHFNGGDYYEGPPPRKGLALARMIAHKTYVSLQTMENRAREEVVGWEDDLRLYQITHTVESYMLHQGHRFVDRFDANTYLRIIEAWQGFDLVKDTGAADLPGAFSRCAGQRFLVFSIDSDVCSYPEEQEKLVQTLKQCDLPVQHITVHSDKGHDAFLLDPALFSPYLSYTLNSC
jgi:homoserine O-acetyltransferase/O-succinyltransferase